MTSWVVEIDEDPSSVIEIQFWNHCFLESSSVAWTIYVDTADAAFNLAVPNNVAWIAGIAGILSVENRIKIQPWVLISRGHLINIIQPFDKSCTERPSIFQSNV